jgi:hypothetical protein
VISPAQVVPTLEPLTREATATEPERAIVCARCGHALTREEARVTQDGAHVHTRINPHGYVFELGCFAEAPGCVTIGPAVAEHTWFPPHAWRLGHCGACGEHVGWRFEGGASVFWGLILERLR